MIERVKFGCTATETFANDKLPTSLVNMLIFMAREAVTTTELFRKPGNQVNIKILQKMLTDGEAISFDNFTHYTMASVLKNFLLHIPGGLLGYDSESKLLSALPYRRSQQYDIFNRVIMSLSGSIQKFFVLLVGTWFRIANHSQHNHMTPNNIAISVAGSVFHTCVENRKMIKDAVKVLSILISDFGVSHIFGKNNLDFFMTATGTGLCVRETYYFSVCNLPANESKRHLELLSVAVQSECARLGLTGTAESPKRMSFLPSSTSDEGSFCHEQSHDKDNANLQDLEENEPEEFLQSESSLSQTETLEERLKFRLKKRYDWFLSPVKGDLGQMFGGSSPETMLYRSDPVCDTSSTGSPSFDHANKKQADEQNAALQQVSHGKVAQKEEPAAQETKAVQRREIGAPQLNKSQSTEPAEQRGRSRQRDIQFATNLTRVTVENTYGQK